MPQWNRGVRSNIFPRGNVEKSNGNRQVKSNSRKQNVCKYTNVINLHKWATLSRRIKVTAALLRWMCVSVKYNMNQHVVTNLNAPGWSVSNEPRRWAEPCTYSKALSSNKQPSLLLSSGSSPSNKHCYKLIILNFLQDYQCVDYRNRMSVCSLNKEAFDCPTWLGFSYGGNRQ